MKRTNTNEFTPLFLEHHMLTNNIDDVGTLADEFGAAFVKPGVVREGGSFVGSGFADGLR